MIIILNGPPGCGKDTLGELIHRQAGMVKVNFKSPMWEIAKASLGEVTYNKFCQLYDNRDTKEAPQDFLGGFSPREFFIHISERWCKPVFGDEYFGERFLSTVRAMDTYDFIVTDGGFPKELEPTLKAHLRVVVVRLHREGFTFKGDSRDYYRDDAFNHLPPLLRPKFLDIELISGDPQGAVDKILGAVK